ncbi:MAG: sn-glycerol-1-phosphate dehydrogenase [Firmicutes bacterium]|nr:sn-glycerol-1-phosphate dehydrogenase [Bacillota bacterium]
MELGHMDMDLLGRSFRCTCGREHHVPIRQVVVGDDAMARMREFARSEFVARPGPGITAGGSRAVLVADRNTYAAAGDAARSALEGAGCDVEVLVLGEDGGNGRCVQGVLEADEEAIGSVLARLSGSGSESDVALSKSPEPAAGVAGSAAVRKTFAVAVGSGTINDIVKYASFKAGCPYISVPTAPSMDGYTSSVAALLLGGFKRTLPAAPPLAVFADLGVLSRAPSNMVAAGFGDLLGKLMAGADWVLARLVNGEYYCELAADLARSIALECMERGSEIGTHTKGAIKSLTEGLIWSGIAMLMVGNSRPASGAEHHLSHYWELKSLREGRPQPFHGTKVGVATILIAGVYDDILGRDPRGIDLADLKRRHPSREEREARIRRFYGPMAGEAIIETAGKYLPWEEREKKLREVLARWDEIRDTLREIVPGADRVRDALEQAGAPATPEAIGFSSDWVWEALANAKDLRMRFTVLDFADLLGFLDEIASARAYKRSQGGS